MRSRSGCGDARGGRRTAGGLTGARDPGRRFAPRGRPTSTRSPTPRSPPGRRGFAASCPSGSTRGRRGARRGSRSGSPAPEPTAARSSPPSSTATSAAWSSTGRAATADAAPREGEIVALYVHPENWRSGIGRALVAAALDALADAGHSAGDRLDTRREPRNLSFYESLGFARDGGTQRRPSFGSPLEVRFRLTLADRDIGL